MAEFTQSSSGGRERNDLLLYILNNASTKLPLKQPDMAELFGKQSKNLQPKLAEVTLVLKNIYGIILKEVPNKKSGVKKFICYAETSTNALECLDEEQKREMTLLFIILSYIFLKSGSVYEEQLASFLETLSIDIHAEHCYFGGNLKKLILETFVKQLYLTREKSDSELDVDVRYVLTWGFRAKMEFKKKQVLDIAAKLMGHSPEYFQTQYRDACAEESDDDDDGDDDVTLIED